MRPKEVEPPSITETITNFEHWNKRRLNYCGDDIYFDQEIRTGKCILCEKDGRLQKSSKTFLHHLKYDQFDKLAWTIEVCGKCHWQIDSNNRKAIAKKSGRNIPYRHGEYYLNEKQRKEQDERDEREWYKRYCMNLPEGFVPIKEYIPNQEFYDEVVAAIKADSPSSRWKRTTFKKEPMSDVSSRYY